jgi:CHAT domain-containing protein
LLLVRPAGDDLFVFAVTPDHLAWHRIRNGVATVTTRVARLRCQVDPLTCMGRASGSGAAFALAGTRAFDAAAAFGLYTDVIKPVEAALISAKRLYVTISGPLADLPLDILVTQVPASPADPEFLRRTAWLGDSYAMISLPAISALSTANTPGRAQPIAFVGYGAPVLGVANRLADFLDSSGSTEGNDARSADRARLAALVPLPGTEVELRAMAKVLGATAGNIVLGPAATEAALRADRRIASARVVAFATHGLLPRELNGSNEPALVMSVPKPTDAGDDGLLTASEASQLSIGAEWVILSACNTASAEGSADSLSALSRGFLYAGAQALLASHWRVADDATAALTVETLAAARLQPGLSRAEARQRAMRAVRTGRRDDGTAIAGWTNDWLHPAAWAPFTLIAADDR